MPYEIHGHDGIKMITENIAACVSCGEPAPFLCDYEVSPGRTCDRPICGRCRYNVGVKDYCPEHAGKIGRLNI